MDETLSDLESEETTEENNQDEFDMVEVEAVEGEAKRRTYTCQDNSTDPYADEHLADEEWLRGYRNEQKERTNTKLIHFLRLFSSIRLVSP